MHQFASSPVQVAVTTSSPTSNWDQTRCSGIRLTMSGRFMNRSRMECYFVQFLPSLLYCLLIRLLESMLLNVTTDQNGGWVHSYPLGYLGSSSRFQTFFGSCFPGTGGIHKWLLEQMAFYYPFSLFTTSTGPLSIRYK